MWMVVGIVALLGLAISFLGLVFGLIKPSIVHQTSRRAVLVKMSLAMLACFLVSMVAALSDQSRSAQQPTAHTPEPVSQASPAAQAAPPTIEQTLKGASKRVGGVELRKEGAGTYVTFRHRTESAWSESTFVDDVALDLWTVLKKTTAAHGQEIAGYTAIVEGPTVDRYGNERAAEMIRFSFTGADMLKVNWASTRTSVLLNLSNPSYQPVGRRVALAWCSDDANRRQGREFCENLLR